MRFCVTGGAGFIGSNLVKRLHADGHQVMVLDNMSRGQARRLHALLFDDSGVDMTIGDVRDLATVKRALDGCDSVIHMAMVQGTQRFTEDPWLTQDVALNGTMNVLKAMQGHGIRDLMLISSSEAYQGERDKVPTAEDVWLSVPDPLNPRFSYGGGKLAMEVMCAAFAQKNLDRLIIARPHNVTGPDMGHEHIVPQFIDRMAAGEFKIQGTGKETRALCYISDCIDALALLLNLAENGSSIWHIGTQDERSVQEIAHEVAHCFGVKIEVIPGELPKGSPPRRCPDISKIRALGYEPRVGFIETIRRTVEWYRANG